MSETTTTPSGPLFTEPAPAGEVKAAEPVKVEEKAPVEEKKPETKPKAEKKPAAKPKPAPKAKAKPVKKPAKRKPAKPSKKAKAEARSGVAIAASTHRKVIRLQAKLKAKTGERVSLSDTIDRAVSKLL